MIKRNLKISLSLVLILLSSTIVYAVDPSPGVGGGSSSVSYATNCPVRIEAFWNKSVVFPENNVTFTIKFYDANGFLISGLPRYFVSEAYINNTKQDHIPSLYASDPVFSGGDNPYFPGTYSHTDIVGVPPEGYGVYRYVYVTNIPGCIPVNTTAQIELIRGCIHAIPSITISPSSNVAEVGKDTKFIYAVEINNNDNSVCDPSVFNIRREYNPTLTVYDGFGKNTPPIKPGDSFKYAMQVSASSQTRIANYSIVIGIMNDISKGYNSTARADLDVVLKLQNETQSSEKTMSIEIPKTEEKSAINQVIKCDSGCLYEGACLSYGLRVQKGNVSEYCDVTGQIMEQKQESTQCQNNYECSSNFCSEGKCVSALKEAGQTKGVFQSILFFFKTLFGF